jgi:hypothetical protein
MNKTIIAGFAAILAGGSVNAALITFDDLTEFDPVPNAYAGLSWNNLNSLNATTYTGNPSGYGFGLVSPDFVAYNGDGDPAGFGMEPGFVVNSFYLTAAWRDDLDVLIQGLLDGSPVISTSIQIDSTIQSLVTLNWSGIDEVRLITSGGVENPSFQGSGTHFALDNLVINSEFQEVPEAGTWFAGATVALIGGATYLRRRR